MACTSQEETTQEESYLLHFIFPYYLSLFFLQAKERRLSTAAFQQFSSTGARRSATVRTMLSISSYNQYFTCYQWFCMQWLCVQHREKQGQIAPAFTEKGLGVASPRTTSFLDMLGANLQTSQPLEYHREIWEMRTDLKKIRIASRYIVGCVD